MEEVSKLFTGIVLEVERSINFRKIKNKNKFNLYELFKKVSGINKFFIFLILLSLSIEVLSLLNPLFIQYITDNVIISNDVSNLYVISIAFIILIFVQIYTEYIRGNMIIYLTKNLTEKFSSNVVKYILKLPLDFFEKRHKGDIQSKFNSIDQIQKKISTDFVNTVLDGLMVIINITVMFIYNKMLTMVVIFTLFIYFTIRYTTYHVVKKQTESSIFQYAKSASIFLETLQCIIPIKSFLKEHIRFNAWRNSYINFLNADIRVAKINVIYNIINQFLFNIEHIFVICIGAYLVLVNKFSVGMLIAFLSYRLSLVNKASSFIQNIFDYKLISIQLRRLSDILFQQPEVIDTGFGNIEQIKGALSVKNISFRYTLNDKYILNNISLNIEAGEKVAIIGPSGCGKSTFLKIMMGLLDKTEGEIFIDGISIKDFGLRNYRCLTACVMQEDSLMSGSILDNITFFDENIDIERVYNVAKLSFVHDIICKLPMGYETLIGDMGSTLSGGQKQKILLARALYKKPKILFLDEATSHLDIVNEKNINNSLKSLRITQVIIAHRLETIQMADRVIDLESINNL
ncbi:peptidase domain-containing ABC transporter [Legionella oakridgensis]|uniref:ABC-type bacteriocin/lantibiotic exporters, containing an N-terminal double-glycine peptidase domain n=2 Tax=Legionella oakridgensis TaxID=29423 RepID=W0BC51_9GAMM|nr:peptidase domain-containing ABC transporter [Legionella oakridgensis]AHE66207.1 ABC-type bacteriocin/lantibiotic exporters, containing an N-terminal double-glycine peptidase domain [Legionella oakridgensis ATCC 33761 = DSM 21215]KTD42324.1 ABC transporter [Legionella oakridgensis]STY16114.1 ABC transporter [Legionella longbeachae]